MPNNIQKINFVSKIHDFVKTKVSDGINNTPKHLPGHVSKILPNDFVEFTIDATGPYTLPKLTIPQAFSKYHREPTAVGDKGYAVGASINIGGSSGQDGSTANMYSRGNLTTGTFHPISNKNFPVRDPDQFLVTGGKSGHKTQSADTKTSSTIDNSGSGKIDHVAAKGVTTKATTGDINASAIVGNVTHAAANGIMNLVQNSLNIGKAADPNAFPPIPSLPTIMNLIGSLTASGSMGATGGFAGAPGGSAATAGNVGEVISSNVTTPISLVSTIQTNITSITLTAGDWDVQGETWVLVGTGGATGIHGAISNVTASIPGASALNTSRMTINTTFNPSANETFQLKPCRVNVSVSTIYYLVCLVVFPSGACTATGNIWARRAR